MSEKANDSQRRGRTLVELYPLRGQVLQRARERGICEICRVCDGRMCAGRMPGIGSVGSGSSAIRNYDALGEYRIVERIVDSTLAPDLAFSLFGTRMAAPVLPAPMAVNRFNLGEILGSEEFARAIYEGGWAAGVTPMLGHVEEWPPFAPDSVDPPLDGSLGLIPVIKPLQDKLLRPILERVVSLKAPAVGIDIDSVAMGVIFPNLPVEAKTSEQLRDLASWLPVPLILKGVMSVADAEQAIQVGAKAIVVSNHGGRIMDGLPGAADVLPEIVETVGGCVPVLVDGAVRSGYDAFKYLALGADAVLVGRPLIFGVAGQGAEGVQVMLECMIQELRQAMAAAGCRALSDVSRDCVCRL